VARRGGDGCRRDRAAHGPGVARIWRRRRGRLASGWRRGRWPATS
jgi:hypothetical protein